MKKVLLFLLASTLLFSCSEDEPTPEPTVQEIQQDIQRTFDGFVTCMQGYESGEFSDYMQDFLMISNGDMESEYAEFLADELSEFEFDFEDFSMANHSGVYDWSATSEMWNYTANTTNSLEFNFPFTDGGTINNTTMTINNYEVESYINMYGETEYRPLRILASIEKDGNEFFNIDLDNVSYRMVDGESTPESFNLEIRTSPMTHTFTLAETVNSQLDFSYSSHNDNSCSTTFSIEGFSNITDIALIEDANELNSISAVVGHGSLEIRFDAQNINSFDFENANSNDINNLLNVEVYLNNSKIGELEVEGVENEEEVIFIVYNDGTRENVENYVDEELANELEGIFSNFIE